MQFLQFFLRVGCVTILTEAHIFIWNAPWSMLLYPNKTKNLILKIKQFMLWRSFSFQGNFQGLKLKCYDFIFYSNISN